MWKNLFLLGDVDHDYASETVACLLIIPSFLKLDIPVVTYKGQDGITPHALPSAVTLRSSNVERKCAQSDEGGPRRPHHSPRLRLPLAPRTEIGKL